MSTSEQEAGQLTRKQLRERRLADSAGERAASAPVHPAQTPTQVAPAAPLPRAAELTVVPEAPTPEAATSRRTRRQVREQERVRTASVSQVQNSTPAAAGVPSFSPTDSANAGSASSYAPGTPSPASYTSPESYARPTTAPDPQGPIAPRATPPGGPQYGQSNVAPVREQQTYERPHSVQPPAPRYPVRTEPAREQQAAPAPVTTAAPSHEEQFGQAEDSSGSSAAASALIMSQQPGVASLAGPIAGTGEILMTGSYELPAGLGSTGYAPGTTDGKEADLVLIDGELAPTSSPTPIAASSAISTIKPAGEVIRPPEPDKGNRVMWALTITAGTLALALVGVVVVAITTGALN